MKISNAVCRFLAVVLMLGALAACEDSTSKSGDGSGGHGHSHD